MKSKKIIYTFLIFILVFSFSLQAEEIEEVINAISIQGNDHISNGEITSVIETKIGDSLNRDLLKKDLKTIYDLGYFQDVKISFKNYQGGLELIFEVIENPVLKEIEITGNEIITDSTIIEWLDIKTGKLLNVVKLNESLKRVQENYQDQGYILAKFDDVNISPDGILKLSLNPGYINKIVLSGNEKSKDFVILREMEIKEGQVVNINDIKSTYRNIYRLNYFEDVQPELKKVEGEDNKVDLLINLVEKKTGNMSFGAVYSTKDGLYGYINVKEKNLLGNGQSLGFEWQFGDLANYSLNFYEPWLMNMPTSLGVGLYDRSSNNEDLIKGEYTEKRKGASISFGHEIAEEWDGSIRLKIENTATEWENDSYEDENNIMQDLEDESGRTRSLTLKAHRDTTNHPFNPTSGGIDIASLEYAGQTLGGDYNFTKYNLDIRRFYPGFENGHAWALRIKTGIGDREIPFSEQYRLGGSESLRGYEANSFSGDDMLLLNLEYRFPIADNFTGVIFGDAGNTWEDAEEIKLEDLHMDLGLGVRMNTPIGQIRLDYAFDEEGQGRPQLSIGNTF